MKVSAESLANSVLMHRVVKRVPCVILEGYRDILSFNPLLVADLIVVTSLDRAVSLRTSEILLERGMTEFISIIDADFSHICRERFPPHVLLTDTHDVETMMLSSPALDRVLGEFASAEKVAKFVLKGSSVRDVVLRAAQEVGLFRLANHREFGFLKFEGLTFSRFIEGKTLEVSRENLCKELLSNSRRPPSLAKEVLQAVEVGESENHDAWQIACGHDCIEIWGRGVRG
jgi:hypothetical protein